MTTPSPARQAAEAYACETGYKPEAFDIKWAVAHDAFLAGAAWMNEQCAKECDKQSEMRERLARNSVIGGRVSMVAFHEECERDALILADKIRALMPEQDGTREGK